MKNPKKRKFGKHGTSLDVFGIGKLSYLQMKLQTTTSNVLRLGLDALYEKYRDEKSDEFIGLNDGS